MLDKTELMGFSINRLRGIDIASKEDEKIVQEVLDLKTVNLPLENPINATSGQTDDLTPEKEAELQAEINRKTEEKRGTAFLQVVEEVLVPTVETVEVSPVEEVLNVAIEATPIETPRVRRGRPKKAV